MLRFRTKLLLALMVITGLGIGVLSVWADGLYSAICLFMLPILVALLGASIIADFNRPTNVEAEAEEQAATATWTKAA